MTATLDSPAQSLVKPLIGRDYFRNSSGDEQSLERQESDNTRMFSSNDWLRHAEPYSDLVSASKYGRKTRGDYERLISDLKSGKFGADYLVIHEASRGSRKLSEWCHLIELCEEAGVLIAVSSQGKIYDPSDGRDVRALQEDGVDAQYESAKLSGRILSGKRLVREEKKLPNNGKRYGYRPIHEIVSGKSRLVGLEPHPEEKHIVWELFGRFAKGESLRSIELNFISREIKSRNGKYLSRPVLMSMLRSPAYIGKLVYQGKTYDGCWPALVKTTVWYQCQQILDENAEATRDRTKTQRRHGRAVHLLSGIIKCDSCGHGMAYLSNNDRAPVYRCKVKGCTRVDYREMNYIATELILAYLKDEAHLEALTRDEDRSEDIQAVKDELATISMELDELERDVEAEEISARMATARERGLEARKASAKEKLEELQTPSRLAGLLPPGKRLEDRWKAATDQQKRQIAAYLLTKPLIGELHIRPARRSGSTATPIPERLAVVRQ